MPLSRLMAITSSSRRSCVIAGTRIAKLRSDMELRLCSGRWQRRGVELLVETVIRVDTRLEAEALLGALARTLAHQRCTRGIAEQLADRPGERNRSVRGHED